MDFEDVSLLQTCGICKTICDQSEIENHSCLEGYAQYTTDLQTFYFYPVLDDGLTIIRKSRMPNNEEQVVATRLQEKKTNSITSKRKEILSEVQNALKRPQKNSNEGIKAKLNHNDEETLILEVQSREPLWNHKLPLPQRNIRIVKNLWQEVANALNGKITADEAKAKFKSLHDTYRRIIKLEACASGSARKDSGKKWAHYDSMEFMRDSCLLKTTVSNIEDPINNDLEDNGESIENIGLNHGSRNKRKRNDSNTCINAIEQIANALCDNVMPDLPPPPIPDEIDSFLSMLGCQLRELASRKQREVMRRILNITYDALAEQYE